MSAMRSRLPFRSINGRLCAAVFAALLWLLPACTEPLDYKGDVNDPYANFDQLARIVGDRYCFFSQKNIDWQGAWDKYRKRITPDMKQLQLFSLMSQLLDTLRDGHVNLIAPFANSYYKKWWSDYPQDFDERTLQQYYLKFGGLQKAGMTYCVFLPDTIGYLRIPSFSSAIPASTLDYVFSYLREAKGLVIDVRNNGGGMLSNVPQVLGRFIDADVCGGYIRHKTGPGPQEFSEPYEIKYEPARKHVRFLNKPIMVLTNRSSFSAANDFVAVMKSLPQVRVVGARTGGGGGLPFNSQLPNGWGIRFSACPINDCHDQITEFGIDPSPGCEVHCTPQELADGKDRILEFALSNILK